MNIHEIPRQKTRIINRWVVVGSILISVLLITITCLFGTIFRKETPSAIQPTAIVKRIPASTSTPTSVQFDESSQSSEAGSQAGLNISISSKIRVEGTGGDGLRLRSEAGLSGKILFLIDDGEELIIIDGPKEVDGYTWWQVTSVADSTISGWGVSDYMVISENP